MPLLLEVELFTHYSLQQALEIDAITDVKDLVVVTTPGPQARATIAARRMATATSRMKRIDRIPAPALAVVAGATAGVEGAVCGSPLAQELDTLRWAARAAACHGGIRAAPEIVFG